MSKGKSIEKNLVRNFLELLCTEPEVKNLTPEQRAALHLCKHEMISAVYRLYMEVPQPIADKILAKYFKIPDNQDAIR